MRSILVLCGMVMLSTTATPNNLKTPIENQESQLQPVAGTRSLVPDNCVTCRNVMAINLDDIRFIEEEDTVDLGFDTAEYLPEGFDPYEVYVDLDAINYIEENEGEELGFETTAWLPEGFNPYAAPADFASISYLEPEGDLLPEFDTKAWLPEGFDAYAASPANKVICRELGSGTAR